MSDTPGEHEGLVRALLNEAKGAHALLLVRMPPEIARSLPVDAQGITQAIEFLADAAGFDAEQRRDLFRGHAVNPAVLHARVFGASGLTDATVIAAFVDGARVRAESLGRLADAIGGEPLGAGVRRLLADHPPPADASTEDAVAALRDAYDAQEQAALLIARRADALGLDTDD